MKNYCCREAADSYILTGISDNNWKLSSDYGSENVRYCPFCGKKLTN